MHMVRVHSHINYPIPIWAHVLLMTASVIKPASPVRIFPLLSFQEKVLLKYNNRTAAGINTGT